jgi:hypothetical protein
MVLSPALQIQQSELRAARKSQSVALTRQKFILIIVSSVKFPAKLEIRGPYAVPEAVSIKNAVSSPQKIHAKMILKKVFRTIERRILSSVHLKGIESQIYIVFVFV